MFYDRLIGLCKARGIRLTPLLKELNLSESGIARWKSGSVPNGRTLAKMAAYFDVTEGYLLGSEDLPQQGEVKLDDIQFALFKETADLTDSDKRDILTFARFIKEQRRKEGR